MMGDVKTTIVGLLADKLGHAAQRCQETGVRESFAVPALEYRSRQPADLTLDVDHHRIVGRVRHLERTDGNLWLVAEVHSPETVDPSARYLSPSVELDRDGRNVELRSVSLTANPATVNARPVHELPGDIRAACRHAWRLRNPFLTTLLEHARDSTLGASTISGPAPEPIGAGAYIDEHGELLATRSRVDLEYRYASGWPP